MKILHVNNEKSWRGGERQTLVLAGALRELGIGCRIGCRPGAPLEEHARKAGVDVVPIAGDALRAGWQLASAARWCDVIHCHTGRVHSLAAATGWLHHKPVVATRRIEHAQPRSWFNRYKYDRAARVVCVSNAVAQQLRQWGVPANKLMVVHDAVPPAKASDGARAKELRQRLKIAPDQKVVGTIGALVGHKDHDTLLRAAQRIAKKRTDVRFIIIGDGERKDELLATRRKLGLDDIVHFAGFVPQAEECLPGFDVFALSSNMEGLPNVVLEAFVAGVPVAATAASGTPELVRDGQSGLLVPVGDDAALAEAIGRLLDDESLRQRLSAAAKSLVESEFTLQRMAEEYLAVYEQALRG